MSGNDLRLNFYDIDEAASGVTGVLESCDIVSMHIDTGEPLGPEDDCDMTINLQFDVHVSEELPTSRMVLLTVEAGNDRGYIYTMTAQVQGIITFPDDATDDDIAAFMDMHASSLVYAAAKPMLESVTNFFPYGMIQLPVFNPAMG